MKTTAPLLALIVLALLAAPVRAEDRQDIVDTAVEAGSFKTLAAALDAADLIATLRGSGPFTVFAPTDEAFARLPEGTVETLLEPENKARLQAILTYHVVPGRVASTDLLSTARAKTANGATVAFGLRVGDANVTAADIQCSNGIIHVIDAVLLPPEPAPPADEPAGAVIRRAIERGVPLYNAGDPAACAAVYETAAQDLLRLPAALLGPVDRDDIERTLSSHARDARARAWDLRRAFDRILANESYTPRLEAPLPEGFPGPGPLGRVVVKSYPAYRAARADGANSFWTLFLHIKRNGVEMTAPVEQTLDEGLRARDMAFLYQTAAQGSAGDQGRVDVQDLRSTHVLSIGMRGERNAERLEAAKAAIEARLADEGWKRTGSWRLMGYNSPMVPASQRFWELQLPAAPIDAR